MTTVTTRQGKQIEVITRHELRDPLPGGAYVRAYCHIHGSDHQRSLSINRATGWGHCFNATCNATVIVAEWNPNAATHLLHARDAYSSYYAHPFVPATPRLPLALQPMLLHLPPQTQKWQQDEQRTLTTLDCRWQANLQRSLRAQTYLTDRGIPLEIAQETGVGYLPPDLLPRMQVPEQRSLLRRWAARLVFPLISPFGSGYIGRSLWQWRPGMNENTHKAVLETGKTRRWIKTNPAGWFSCPFDQLAERLILVEGAFDRLTLLAAGFDATEVVALAGTAIQSDWLPPQVKTVVLALDSDQGGKEASERLADQLAREGFAVKISPLPQDRWGKDWNERWRRIGQKCVLPLYAACSTLRSA